MTYRSNPVAPHSRRQRHFCCADCTSRTLRSRSRMKQFGSGSRPTSQGPRWSGALSGTGSAGYSAANSIRPLSLHAALSLWPTSSVTSSSAPTATRDNSGCEQGKSMAFRLGRTSLSGGSVEWRCVWSSGERLADHVPRNVGHSQPREPAPPPILATISRAFTSGAHPCLEIHEFRESRKFVPIAALNRALCDILCRCPRGNRLRGS